MLMRSHMRTRPSTAQVKPLLKVKQQENPASDWARILDVGGVGDANKPSKSSTSISSREGVSHLATAQA